ncbi:MAG: hypothetical protein RL160_1278 [Bacteroidota bacterium]
MKTTLLISIGILLCAPEGLHAQQQAEPCGQVEYQKQLELKHPGFHDQMDRVYRMAQDYANGIGTRKKVVADTVFTIPVVFHILYSNAAENLNDSLIYSQLFALNRDFRKRNADTSSIRTLFKSRASDTKIQFVMAAKDPSGKPSTGINRVATTKASFGNLNLTDDMKFRSRGGADAWDTKKYLNIWVCDLSIQNIDALLGYAYPPLDAPNWTAGSFPPSPDHEGVVLHYKVVGINNPYATGSLASSRNGRTAVHEVGHFLGLRHVWGDPPNGVSGCAVDDGIDDTPLCASRSNFDCNKTRNTCNTGAGDEPDQVENYMDYSSHTCQTMFSKKQMDIMRFCIVTFRSNLYEASISRDTLISGIRMFPNPSIDGFITVEIEADLLQKHRYSLTLTDMNGRVVLDPQPCTQISQRLDLSRFSRGTYYVELRDELGQPVIREKLLRF